MLASLGVISWAERHQTIFPSGSTTGLLGMKPRANFQLEKTRVEDLFHLTTKQKAVEMHANMWVLRTVDWIL